MESPYPDRLPPMDPSSTGIPITENPPFPFGGKQPRIVSNIYEKHNNDMIKSMKYEESELKLKFFSNQNVDLLQKMIQEEVYVKTNKKHTIGRQADDQLLIIMKSMFLQHGRFLDVYIDEQITELNRKVSDECTRIILPNLAQHLHYIENLEKNISEFIMDYGKSTNTAGSKTVNMRPGI